MARKIISKFRLLTIVIAILAIVGAGCTQSPTPQPETQPEQVVQPTNTTAPIGASTQAPPPTRAVEDTPAPEAPPDEVTGKQLIVARDFDLNTIDPHRAFEDTALIVLKAMYDQLTGLDEEDPSLIVPSLAESWDISEDGLVYTFSIRSGVKFTSGNDLTAEDVEFSLNRLKNLMGNPSFLLDGVASVEATGPLTVVVTLENPDASFLSKTAGIYMSIVDSKLAAENGATSGPDAADTDTSQEWLDANSAGSGPFIFESWTRNQDIRFTANTDYWKGRPNVDSIILRDLKDITTQKQLLQQGDLDIAMNIDPDAAQEIQGMPGVVIQQQRGFNQVYMAITQIEEVNEALATNQALRQAISYAIDYDGLNNLVLAGNAEQPPSIVPNGFLSADLVPLIVRDLDKANQLMVEAGYPDGISLELYYPNATFYGVDFNLVAQKLQADLAEVGINITPIPQATSVFNPAYRASELPMVFSYWAPDWMDPNTLIDSFATPSSIVAKRMGYVNEENAELSMQGMASTDREERAQIYAQIQRNLQEDAHILGMIQPKVVLAYRDNILNYKYHPIATVDLYAVDKR